MSTVENDGEEASEKVGEMVPLKFTPPEAEKPLLRASVCVPVPENITLPLLVSVPLFETSPENVSVEEPVESEPLLVNVPVIVILSEVE